MSSIALPKAVETAFRNATDHKKSDNQLSKHLRTELVLDGLIGHRKTFSNICDAEYRATLETILSFYRPGEAVGVNELAKNASSKLDERFEDRRISQTAIRDSFIPLLREIDVIEGDGRLTWAYLDTPSAFDKFKYRTRNMYTAYMAQTDHEAKLKHALRDNAAMRKLETVVMTSRTLQDDIGNELEYLKRQDRKHREMAMELGVPYSQIKDEQMKQKRSSNINIKTLAFPSLVLGVALFAWAMSPDDSATTEQAIAEEITEQYSEAPAPVDEYANEYGLGDGEMIWRNKYVELYRANNGYSAAMDDELFDLANIHMISRPRMELIVATITDEEVQP